MTYDKDYIQIVLEDNERGEYFENLTWAVFNKDFEKVERYLKDERYVKQLQVQAVLNQINPLSLALDNGDPEIVEILLKHNARLDSTELIPLLNKDFETIKCILPIIEKYKGIHELNKIINTDDIKNVILAQDSPDLLDYLKDKYGISFIMEDGTSMLYHCAQESNVHNYLINKGFQYTPHDSFLCTINNAIQDKDATMLNTLFENDKNIAFVTEELFIKVLFNFNYSEASLALEKMSLQLNVDEIISFISNDWDEKTQPELQKNDKARLIYNAFLNALQKEGVEQFKSFSYKFFSHVLGLSGTLESFSNAQLEGSPTSIKTLGYLVFLFDRYIKQNNEHTFSPYLTEVNNALQASLALGYFSNKKLHRQLREESLESGRLVIIPCRSTHHIFGLSLIKKADDLYYVSITNRGDSTRFSGSEIYEVNQEQAHAILSKFATPKYGYDYQGNIHSQTENNQIFYDIIGDKEPIKKLSANYQKFGTCSFVNPKRCIESGLFLLALREGNAVLKERANEIYKDFSQDTQETAINMLYELIEQNKNMPLYEEMAVRYILLQHNPSKDKSEATLGKKLLSLLPNKSRTALGQIYDSNTKIPFIVDNLEDLPLAISMAKLSTLLGVSDGILSIEVKKNQVIINVNPSREDKNTIMMKFRFNDSTSSSKTNILDLENIKGEYGFKINNVHLDKINKLIAAMNDQDKPLESSPEVT